MRISDWSSDVCSSDLLVIRPRIDIYMFRWLYRTLMNCNLQSYRAHKSPMLRVATYRRDCLEQLRQATGIAYEGRCSGTLQKFGSASCRERGRQYVLRSVGRGS